MAAEKRFLPFAEALPSLEVAAGEMGSEWLNLPERVEWPGRARHTESIMIRPCYKTAISKLNDIFGFPQAPTHISNSGATQSNTSETRTGKYPAAVVTGEEGIGKSSMGLVYCRHLAQLGKRFVLECLHNDRVRLLFNYSGDEQPLLQVGGPEHFRGGYQSVRPVYSKYIYCLLQDKHIEGSDT
jgi:hypothetical protein